MCNYGDEDSTRFCYCKHDSSVRLHASWSIIWILTSQVQYEASVPFWSTKTIFESYIVKSCYLFIWFWRKSRSSVEIIWNPLGSHKNIVVPRINAVLCSFHWNLEDYVALGMFRRFLLLQLRCNRSVFSNWSNLTDYNRICWRADEGYGKSSGIHWLIEKGRKHESRYRRRKNCSGMHSLLCTSKRS